MLENSLLKKNHQDYLESNILSNFVGRLQKNNLRIDNHTA